jgi:hypothetical protein
MGRVDHPERGVSAEARISACRVARSEFARAFQFVAASTVSSGVNPCLNAGSADRTEATHVITHTLPLLDMPSRSWPSALLPLWAPAPPSHGDFISVPRSARLLDSYSRRQPLPRRLHRLALTAGMAAVLCVLCGIGAVSRPNSSQKSGALVSSKPIRPRPRMPTKTPPASRSGSPGPL